jgi:hypothetical protein
VPEIRDGSGSEKTTGTRAHSTPPTAAALAARAVVVRGAVIVDMRSSWG